MTTTLPTTSLEVVTASPPQHIVAVVVWHRGRVALLKRSQLVHHDRGRWHCVTGYLSPGADPVVQALEELFEETGLRVPDLGSFVTGDSVTLADDAGGTWVVHTFWCDATSRYLRLNWEHDAYRWVNPKRLAGFDPVGWLADVLAAVNRTTVDHPPATSRAG